MMKTGAPHDKFGVLQRLFHKQKGYHSLVPFKTSPLYLGSSALLDHQFIIVVLLTQLMLDHCLLQQQHFNVSCLTNDPSCTCGCPQGTGHILQCPLYSVACTRFFLTLEFIQTIDFTVERFHSCHWLPLKVSLLLYLNLFRVRTYLTPFNYKCSI